MAKQGGSLHEQKERCLLGEESRYRATPQQTDGILCFGSDDEDGTARNARMLRYENQTIRYLNGEPPRILSASLRGPFDAASGWENPWRNNGQPKARNLITTLDHHFDTEKQARIEAWTRNITITSMEMGEFWAPDHGVDELSDETSRKRPAGKGWLKSKIAKRRRANFGIPTTVISTPTPAPVPKPIAKTKSALVSTTVMSASDKSSGPANRSLDMPTPSSSPPKSISASTRQTIGISSECATSGDELSNVNLPGTASQPRQRILPLSRAPSQRFEMVTYDGINEPTSELSSLDSSQMHRGEEPGSHEELPPGGKADASFQFHIDQSFYYRARSTRSGGVARTKDSNDPQFQPVQAGTPPSETFEDQIDIDMGQDSPPREALQQDQPASGVSSPPSQVDDAEDEDPHMVIHRPPPRSMESASLSDDDLEYQSVSSESPDRPQSMPQTAGHRSDAVHTQPSCDIPKAVEQSVGPQLVAVPTTSPTKKLRNKDGIDHEQRIIPHEAACRRMPAVQEFFSEPMMDEGSTLVGDVMDVDDQPSRCIYNASERLEMAKSSARVTLVTMREKTLHLVQERETLRQRLNADVDALDFAEADRLAPSAEITEDGSVSDNSEVMVPISKTKWGVVEVASSPIHPPPNVGGAQKTAFIKIEPVDEGEDERVLQLPKAEPQRPEAPAVEPIANLDGPHVKSEPAQEQWTPGPPVSLLSTPGSDFQHRGIGPSQQTPWATPIVEPIRTDRLAQPIMTPRLSISEAPAPEVFYQSPGTGQSPWANLNVQIMPASATRLSNSTGSEPGSQMSSMDGHQPVDTRGKQASSSVQSQPQDPLSPYGLEQRASTPDLDLSIKSFAKFNTPSPERKSRQQSKFPRLSGDRLPSTQVLIDVANLNPWQSARRSARGSTHLRSSCRVSFAPLPGKNTDNDELPPPHSVARPASPPPQTAVEIGAEDVDDNFLGHFDAMRRRSEKASEDSSPLVPMPKFRLKERLLPDSQQLPQSPDVRAMAEAFKEADAQLRAISLETPSAHDECVEDANEAPQSPWQVESQNQGIDDVAEVLQNLDDFLNPRWDVDAELEKAKSGNGSQSQGRSRESNMLEMGIWDVV